MGMRRIIAGLLIASGLSCVLSDAPARAGGPFFWAWGEESVVLSDLEVSTDRVFFLTLTNTTAESQVLWVGGLDPEWLGPPDEPTSPVTRAGIEHGFGCGGDGNSDPRSIGAGETCQLKAHFRPGSEGCPESDPCTTTFNFMESQNIPALPVTGITGNAGPGPEPADPAVPDLTLARPGKSPLGAGVRNGTGKGQTVTVRSKRGKSVTFTVGVRNVGGSGAIRVRGCGSANGLKVVYKRGDSTITGPVVNGTYSLPFTGKTTTNLTLKIKVTKSAKVGKTRTCAVTGTAEGKDTVKAKVKVL
jgi:hypothetical protein